MSAGRLGIVDEHVALHDAARGWADRHCPSSVPRAWLDGAAPADGMPSFWDDLVAMGWPGIHVSESSGGSGYGVLELGCVLEELGRACAPGPFLATAITAAALDRLGAPGETAGVLHDLAAGVRVGAVADGNDRATVASDGTVTARFEIVPGASAADVVLVPVEGGWALLDARGAEVTVEPRPSTDETVPVADVVAAAAPLIGETLLDPEELVPRLILALRCAEALGVASWCVDTAAAYAQVREQFGRPIGQFQAVKHRCADMLLRLELARAAVWDALRGGDGDALAVAAAGALASDAAVRNALDCVQVLGGIGFTWEHDAHLYVKRALALEALIGASAYWNAEVFGIARAGTRRALTIDLPAEADAVRAEITRDLEALTKQPKSEWRRGLADGGYIAPHWPKPWGRDASAVEQLVIDEELAAAHVRRPHLQVGAWVLPTLIAHGSTELQERFIAPTLRGDLRWCQLFSEPGAGSDLASLTTKASRTDGGWLLSGQKVWTTMAHEVEWGICLARTDPSAPKHDGISCFLVDMSSEGIDVRPLRELTGQALFNEVFLSDVFVPDELVVGAVNSGWAAARTTLANERVSMGDGSSFGLGVEMLMGLVDPDDAVSVDRVGALLAESLALNVLGLRLTVRALNSASAAEPGSESSVRKLLGVEHDQAVQQLGLQLAGRAGAANDGDAAGWLYGFLANRCLTIAGGTSEVQRNVIAERLLGLPRDP